MKRKKERKKEKEDKRINTYTRAQNRKTMARSKHYNSYIPKKDVCIRRKTGDEKKNILTA